MGWWKNFREKFGGWISGNAEEYLDEEVLLSNLTEVLGERQAYKVYQRVMKDDPVLRRMFKKHKGSSVSSMLKPIPDSLKALEYEDDEVETILKHGGINDIYDAATSLSTSRKGFYALYDEMEQDTMVASALELVTDDATQYSKEHKATIWPERGKYKKDIEEFFKYIELENKIWGWAYNICKFGDMFVQVVGKEGVGIVKIVDDYHPANIFRVEVNGLLAAYIISVTQSKAFDDKEQYICEPYHYVHFLNNYKPTFDEITISYYKMDNKTGKEIEHRKMITSSYGTSFLYNGRQAFRNLKLMEKSLALARLARSPQIRIFYLNTDGMTLKERQNYVKDIKEKFKRKKVLNKDLDFFDSRYNPLSYNDDLFIPFTGASGDVRAETLGGEVDVKAMVDMDYFISKFFAGIRIPKVYMGFEEAVPGMNGQALTTMDIRYARMVKKVQRALIQGMERMCQIHLAYKYRKNPIMEEIRLGMVSISSVEENQRLEILERRLAIATTMNQIMSELEGKVDPKIIIKYVFENILSLSGMDVNKVLKPPKEEKPEEEVPGGVSPEAGAEEVPPGGESPEGGEETPAMASRREIEANLVEIWETKGPEAVEEKLLEMLLNVREKKKKWITTEDFKKNPDLKAELPITT